VQVDPRLQPEGHPHRRVPELAVRDFPPGSVHRISGETLRSLDREAMLAWNPRLVRVRPKALRISAALHAALRIG